jgi:signal peptidase II
MAAPPRRTPMTGLVNSTRSALGRHFLWGRLSALGLSLAVLAFLADQSFKWWMLHELDIAASQPIAVTPFFSLVLAWNRGVSYGWFAQNDGLGQLILIVLSLLAAAGLWVWLTRTLSPLTAASLGLIIGGALGNALDRILHGAVADFFLFHAFGFSWYIFNIADIAIVAGVGLLIYESFAENRRQGN